MVAKGRLFFLAHTNSYWSRLPTMWAGGIFQAKRSPLPAGLERSHVHTRRGEKDESVGPVWNSNARVFHVAHPGEPLKGWIYTCQLPFC